MPIGWYCADAVYISEKDMHKASKHLERDVTIYAWGSGANDDQWPNEIHFPY